MFLFYQNGIYLEKSLVASAGKQSGNDTLITNYSDNKLVCLFWKVFGTVNLKVQSSLAKHYFPECPIQKK